VWHLKRDYVVWFHPKVAMFLKRTQRFKTTCWFGDVGVNGFKGWGQGQPPLSSKIETNNNFNTIINCKVDYTIGCFKFLET
jgi:hypothetical protein